MYKLIVLPLFFLTSILMFASESAAEIFISNGKVEGMPDASVEYLENVDISIITTGGVSRSVLIEDEQNFYEDSARVILNTLQPVTSNPKWYIDNYDFNFTWSYEPVKATKIAIIDTGISEELLRKEKVGAGKNFINQDQPPIDDHGHGTALASIIYDMSGPYPFELIPLKSADSKGNLNVSSIIRAIDYAIEINADIINLSFGAKSSHGLELQAIQKAIDSGIIIISSVGNSGLEEYYYPAAYENVLAIGSINENHKRSSFSTINNRIDFVAPGEKLLVRQHAMTDSTKIMNGTSFSSAYFTGQLALLHTNVLNFSLEKLNNFAMDLGAKGYDKEYGNGFLMSNDSLKSLRGKNWGTGMTSNTMKPWIISLSLPVNQAVELENYIKICGSQLQEYPVSIEIVDSSQLSVTPETPLAPGEYWLVIDSGLSSNTGMKLAQPAMKKFIVN